MRSVQGYMELADRAASYKPEDQAKAWFVVGPNSKKLARAEVSLIEYHALKNGLLVTVVEDPESTRSAHIVLVTVNGTALQMLVFASAMASI